MSHERLLLLVLRTKVSPMGPVNVLALQVSQYSHFGRTQLCCVYIYVDCTTCCYSLLKIFRVINFRGFSQPRKYFNNENFPNYGKPCFFSSTVVYLFNDIFNGP